MEMRLIAHIRPERQLILENGLAGTRQQGDKIGGYHDERDLSTCSPLLMYWYERCSMNDGSW